MKCEHNDVIWNESQAISYNGSGVIETGKPDIGTCYECGQRVWAKDIHSEIKVFNPHRGGEIG